MSNAPNEASEGRIEIKLPDNSIQTDDTVWEELESILFQGFLISHSELAGQHFVFKTLNHLELKQLSLYRVPSSSNIENKASFKHAFIAYSIYMANGNNALYDRPRNIPRLIKLISKLPASHTDKILEHLDALNSRASHAYPLIEAYVYEPRSRYRWFQVRDSKLNDVSVTGIAGSDEIGLNSVQLTWLGLNRLEDRKDKYEADWNNAKFIGGCFAGKGIKSIDDKDRMRREREKTDREDLKMRVLRDYLNRSTYSKNKKVEMVTLPDGRLAEVVSRHRADSAEELAKQLTAALNKEKDAHDLIVESEHRKELARLAEIEQERRELAKNTVFISESPLGSSVISEKDVTDRMKRMREFMIKSIVKVNQDQDMNSENKE